MRILYHFEQSTFSRRTRLALAHKGVEVELREGRANPEHLAEARRLTPIRTMPVLRDGDRVVADSRAIVQYLDVAYPAAPRLWPEGPDEVAETLAITTACDTALDALVDMGTRYFALRNDAAWPEVLRERMERAHAAIDFVAGKARRPHLVGDAWGAADIWVYSAARWIGGFPQRATSSPLVAQMMTLGFRLPERLTAWIEQHADRPGVRAIYV